MSSGANELNHECASNIT